MVVIFPVMMMYFLQPTPSNEDYQWPNIDKKKGGKTRTKGGA